MWFRKKEEPTASTATDGLAGMRRRQRMREGMQLMDTLYDGGYSACARDLAVQPRQTFWRVLDRAYEQGLMSQRDAIELLFPKLSSEDQIAVVQTLGERLRLMQQR